MPGLFLDTSALAKLYHHEIGSDEMEALAARAGVRLIISQLSLVEMQSVFAGKVRTRAIDLVALDQLRGLFYADLAKSRFEVVLLTHRHLAAAEALVRAHAVERALRTLDALQLSVALDLRRRGTAASMVTCDRNLGGVATREGLAVLDPALTR